MRACVRVMRLFHIARRSNEAVVVIRWNDGLRGARASESFEQELYYRRIYMNTNNHNQSDGMQRATEILPSDRQIRDRNYMFMYYCFFSRFVSCAVCSEFLHQFYVLLHGLDVNEKNTSR